MELAEEVQRVSQLKYNQGIGSSLEVVTAETSYKEAQTNYYSALYDAIVAKIDFDIALGKIK
jgi:outer membrane protein TolC